MPRLMRLVKLVLGALAAVLAVWYQAVLHTAEVKRRKALRRARRARNS